MANRRTRVWCGRVPGPCFLCACPERNVKSFRRHGQAPCSNSPRSCGTARGACPWRLADLTFLSRRAANRDATGLKAYPHEGQTYGWGCVRQRYSPHRAPITLRWARRGGRGPQSFPQAQRPCFCARAESWSRECRAARRRRVRFDRGCCVSALR